MKWVSSLSFRTLGETAKDFGFIGIIDMRLDFVARLATQFPHQRIEHTEHIEIIALARRLTHDAFHYGTAGIFNRRERIGDDERANRRAGNHYIFHRLPDNGQVAALAREAADDAAHGNYDTDDETQGCPSAFGSSFLVSAQACPKLISGLGRLSPQSQPRTSQRRNKWKGTSRGA